MLKLIDITKEYMVEEESVLALHDVSIEFRKTNLFQFSVLPAAENHTVKYYRRS